MFFSSSFNLLIAVILISMFDGTFATYGDANVIPYKNCVTKHQVNIFLGDQFVVDFKLRSSRVDEFNDVAGINITQSIPGISTDVTVILTRAENYLFNVTAISPVSSIYGRSATTLSKSAFDPVKYVTHLTVWNSTNETFSNGRICEIKISSHLLVTNPGVRVDIYPTE